MTDLSLLTPEVCRGMIRTKGSIKKAGKALGVSGTTLVNIINPLNKKQKDCPLTPFGYDMKSKIVWPYPYPIGELEKWIRDALPGQRIILATIPWAQFSKGHKFFLSRAERLGLVELHKGKIRTEMTRIGGGYE